jgi:hypothetical protein
MTAANAVSGAVKVSSLAETKDAVKAIQKCYDAILDCEKLSGGKDWQQIANILSQKQFEKLSDNFQTLVRSDAITAEDKLSLGTIKRYLSVSKHSLITSTHQPLTLILLIYLCYLQVWNRRRCTYHGRRAGGPIEVCWVRDQEKWRGATGFD